MKKIVIEINCGAETCDQCEFVWGATITPFCRRFDKLLTATFSETFLRLPECLEAEVTE